MKQIIQHYRSGKLDLAEVPNPKCSSGSVLVRNKASLISIGTKKAIIDLGKKSLLGMAINGSWLNRFKVFLKGGECAHIVHAEDVADAAMYLTSRQFKEPRCFFCFLRP